MKSYQEYPFKKKLGVTICPYIWKSNNMQLNFISAQRAKEFHANPNGFLAH